MTSPAELANQVWEALTELYGETDVRFNSRSHLDSGLAALSVLEERLEHAEKALEEIAIPALTESLDVARATARAALARGVVGETSRDGA